MSTAIIAAIVSGVAGGLKDAASKSITDAYGALKALLKKRSGGERVVQAVDGVEANPESPGRQAVLREEMEASGAHEDPELVRAAQALLDQLGATPDGERHIQQAIGSYIAQADRGGTAQVHVHRGSSRGESG